MRAPCIRPGGTIGICSPSHIADREAYQITMDAIRAQGFAVRAADNLYSVSHGYLASPEERAADLNQLIRDPEVELVFFGGGEGSAELLPYIDFDAIRQNPKRIGSYSDGTTILGAIWASTGLETYYGQSPNRFPDMSDYDKANFRRHIAGDSAAHLPNSTWVSLTPGCAEGILVGGYTRNFALLLGSRYFPIDLNQKYLLFLEDHQMFGGVDYVSAMLANIEQSPFMAQVTGLLFGHYSIPQNPDLLARLRRLGEKHHIPVVYCDDFGHGDNHAVLPIGRSARLDADRLTLTYPE